MPELLLSPTFWKAAGIGLLVVAITAGAALFVGHYKSLEAQAALVAPLQAANKSLVTQAATNDASAAKAAIEIVAAQKQRDQAVADLGTFQKLTGQISTTLQGISKNANATKNPVCLPTVAERGMLNAAIARFSNPNAGAGSGGTLSQVPAGSH